MGDYTQAWVSVHDCKPEDAARVIAVLQTYDFQDDWGMAPLTTDVLYLGEQYVQDEANLEITDTVAEQLAKIESLVFTVGQASKYEWNGEVRIGIPGFGDWSGETDGGGEVMLREDQVREIVKGIFVTLDDDEELPGDADPATMAEFALDELYGTRYFAETKRLDEANKGKELSTALMCQNCRDGVTIEDDELVGSDGETTCPESDRPHGPAVVDATKEEG